MIMMDYFSNYLDCRAVYTDIPSICIFLCYWEQPILELLQTQFIRAAQHSMCYSSLCEAAGHYTAAPSHCAIPYLACDILNGNIAPNC